MFSFGYFPGIRLSFADLSEGLETSAKLYMSPEKYPKENMQDSKHGENLKSRTYKYYYQQQ
jgi:hypothetical protein